MEESVRERGSMLAGPERRTLLAIAAATPSRVHSDHMTALGVLAAFGVFAGYVLSTFHVQWLWLASGMLVLNWMGDSLDGTLARLRNAERPRYGYYLDHAVDAFTTTLIGVGIGLSPFLALDAALAGVVLYLMMSINVYLEATVYRVFRMDYGVVGPTEARLILIALNTVLIGLVAGLDMPPEGIRVYATITVAAMVAAMLGGLLWRFAGNLRRLRREEPRR